MNAIEYIEAVLFLENNVISIQELSKRSGHDEITVEKEIARLNERYKKQNSALTILQDKENYLLVVRQDLSAHLAATYYPKQKQKLSKALLETLAIIAYSQPITRGEIESYRGVNSDNAIKILLSQYLIKVLGKKAIPGSPKQYGTSSDFLRIFGLNSIKDLPKLQGYAKDIFAQDADNDDKQEQESERQ